MLLSKRAQRVVASHIVPAAAAETARANAVKLAVAQTTTLSFAARSFDQIPRQTALPLASTAGQFTAPTVAEISRAQGAGLAVVQTAAIDSTSGFLNESPLTSTLSHKSPTSPFPPPFSPGIANCSASSNSMFFQRLCRGTDHIIGFRSADRICMDFLRDSQPYDFSIECGKRFSASIPPGCYFFCISCKNKIARYHTF